MFRNPDTRVTAGRLVRLTPAGQGDWGRADRLQGLKPVRWSVLEGEDSTRALAGLLAQREAILAILARFQEKHPWLFRKPNRPFPGTGVFKPLKAPLLKLDSA